MTCTPGAPPTVVTPAIRRLPLPEPWEECLHGSAGRTIDLPQRTISGSIMMNCLCKVQRRKTASIPQQKFIEDQFFEQFAALEEGLALVQIQLCDLSENARLF